MMSEFGSFEESEYGRIQPNYFEQINNDVEKLCYNPGPTLDVQEVYDELNFTNHQVQTYDPHEKQISRHLESNQNYVQKPVLQKNIIEVGQKFRNKYLQAKKGTNQETNDLCVNVCTLMKSFCEDYETFECIEEGDAQLIKEFQKGKSNL